MTFGESLLDVLACHTRNVDLDKVLDMHPEQKTGKLIIQRERGFDARLVTEETWVKSLIVCDRILIIFISMRQRGRGEIIEYDTWKV